MGNNKYKIEGNFENEEQKKIEEEILISEINKFKTSKTFKNGIEFKIELISKGCKRWKCKAVKLNEKIAVSFLIFMKYFEFFWKFFVGNF